MSRFRWCWFHRLTKEIFRVGEKPKGSIAQPPQLDRQEQWRWVVPWFRFLVCHISQGKSNFLKRRKRYKSNKTLCGKTEGRTLAKGEHHSSVQMHKWTSSLCQVGWKQRKSKKSYFFCIFTRFKFQLTGCDGGGRGRDSAASTEENRMSIGNRLTLFSALYASHPDMALSVEETLLETLLPAL